MSWAAQRKLLYFLIFLIIVAVVGSLLFYFFTRHPATCVDNQQDQGEEGIDCGGPCSRLCSASQLTPLVLWARVFNLAPGVYSAGAYIQNPNANAQAFSVPYTFSFYNSTGGLIGTRSGVTFIPAGQNFAVVESNVTASFTTSSSTSPVPPVRTTFQFGPTIPWEKAPHAAADFNAVQMQNLKTTFSSSTPPRVEADVVNISYQDLPRIDVSAILYDDSGNAIGVSKTFVSQLSRQTTEHLVFTWITPFPSTPVRVELLPVVNETF